MVLARISASSCDNHSDRLLWQTSKSSLKVALKEVDFFLSFVGVAFLLSWVGRTTFFDTFSDTFLSKYPRIRTLPASTREGLAATH